MSANGVQGGNAKPAYFEVPRCPGIQASLNSFIYMECEFYAQFQVDFAQFRCLSLGYTMAASHKILSSSGWGNTNRTYKSCYNTSICAMKIPNAD